MAYSISIKRKAFQLRQSGHSIKEIAKKLQIAISTSSVWLRQVEISQIGKNRMVKHKELNRYKMSQKWIEKRQNQYSLNYKNAQNLLREFNLEDKNLSRIICAILFWAEGNKDFSHIRFTNSDPTMISSFLKYFRQSYNLDEAKFRACIHLHEYHNSSEMHSYWSNITNIPLGNFRKAYIKPHTGIRKKSDYKGCITIYYFDSLIAHQLQALYNAISSST